MERSFLLLVCLCVVRAEPLSAFFTIVEIDDSHESNVKLEAPQKFPTKEFVEQIRPYVEKCEEKTGVDKALVEQFTKGKNMADDKNLKCYMKCIFVDLDLLNTETGVFRYEKMLNMLPEEMKMVAFDMGHACIHFKGEEGSDFCQVSYDLHKCWQKRDPKHYFLF